MDYSNARSDEELLDLLRQGDRTAFSDLYNRYWKALLAKATDRLKSQEDAEEVVQELFVNLWRRKEKIQIQYSFKTYVFAVLRYEIMHFVAKRMSRREDLSIDVYEEIPFIRSGEDLYAIEVKELEQQLNFLIDNLPEKCRIIFKMSRDDGMSAKDIADQLDLSHRTVETQIGKAIKSIKNSLKNFNMLIF